MRQIEPGVYCHYKGKMYEVIGVARHSETLEELVVYRQLYRGRFPKGTLWIKPKKMFLEKVLVEGKKTSRFEYLGNKKMGQLRDRAPCLSPRGDEA